MSLINMIAEEVQRHKEFNERRMRERLENDRYEAEMMAPIVQALEEYVATGPTYINPVSKEAPVRYEPIYSEYDPELIIGVRIHAILAEITVFGDQFRVDITEESNKYLPNANRVLRYIAAELAKVVCPR